MSTGAAVRVALPVIEPAAQPWLDGRRSGRRDVVRILYPGPDTLMIRSARPSDAPDIHALLESFAARGLLLHRTLDRIRRMIDDFVVAVECDGRVVGCGALRIYSDTLAEIGALAVREDWHARGVGAHIVRALEAEAVTLGIRRLFALTLQDGFFNKLGFRAAHVREFPEKIARDCVVCAHRFRCTEIAVARSYESSPTAEDGQSIDGRASNG